ncbi:ANKRD12 [Cordylochernes scorpioides]|uniref:ANKRD12 n=1 Tax=Cordylochernes scorpioides TaxID=51811 RepID=A0ABY6LGE8_9ARAC|nr:ANKRD12 [Cordylochernes scorpioides]
MSPSVCCVAATAGVVAGGDKGAQSSRLTIKLSQVKPSDSTSQGYTVSVDSGGSNDVYEFSKEEEPEPANPSDGSNGESEEPRAKRRKSTEKAPPILTPVTATSKSPASKQQRGSETDGEDPPHSPKVPPLKIVLPSSVEVETKERTLPYIVHSSEATTSPPEKEEAEPPPTPAKSKEGSPEERFQRMTRSAHRAAAAQASSSSSSSSENSAPSNSNNNVSTTDGVMGDEPAPELHPRKRKLRPRGEAASTSAAASSTTPPEPPPLPPPLPPLSDEPQQIFNPYQMYQNIRKQVAKKRESMYVVTPKPPQGFKDYLLNRCTYLLADTKTDGPEAKPPADLPEVMQEFYMEQEMERFKLRRQHLVEREKLTLAREQEILRVHARAARAAVNQSVPLSVCSVIKDMEIYNVLEPPKSEPSVAPEASRSRYNGRLFLSWLQDVTDKWDKIKEAMQLRQQNEAESLQAVQKLDWEWKLKEHGLCEPKTNPVIEDFHVPMVIVSTDFELLPP